MFWYSLMSFLMLMYGLQAARRDSVELFKVSGATETVVNSAGNFTNGTVPCNTTTLQNNCNCNCNCNPSVTCAPPVNRTDITTPLLQLVRDQQQQIRTILSLLDNCNSATISLPRDCQELLLRGETTSGTYDIYPAGSDGSSIRVYCDMESTWEGWTVIQRREDGSVNFHRGWEEYSNGFGNVNSEHWLGNDNIHRITTQGCYALRIELEDWDGNVAIATYDKFRVGDSGTKYKLILGQYDGEAGHAGDGLGNLSYQIFRTFDDDQQRDCNGSNPGGWWGPDLCKDSNLNGNYYDPTKVLEREGGVVWKEWKGELYSLKRSEMKIKPVK